MRLRVKPSGMLDGDLLDDVGDVLALVDGVLEDAVDILPLDDVDRLPVVRKEPGDGGTGHAVTLVLEGVDLDDEALQVAPEAAQLGERVVDELALLDDDPRLLDRLGRR